VRTSSPKDSQVDWDTSLQRESQMLSISFPSTYPLSQLHRYDPPPPGRRVLRAHPAPKLPIMVIEFPSQRYNPAQMPQSQIHHQSNACILRRWTYPNRGNSSLACEERLGYLKAKDYGECTKSRPCAACITQSGILDRNTNV
jgi:hypothetical protein